jgi:hypothetical protein
MPLIFPGRQPTGISQLQRWLLHSISGRLNWRRWPRCFLDIQRAPISGGNRSPGLNRNTKEDFVTDLDLIVSMRRSLQAAGEGQINGFTLIAFALVVWLLVSFYRARRV